MSLWIHKQDKDGNRNLYWVGVALTFLPSLTSLFLALFLDTYAYPFYVITVGFVFIFIAKASLFSRGIWFSVGSRQMDKPYKLLYQAGYFLIGFGMSLLLIVYMVLTGS